MQNVQFCEHVQERASVQKRANNGRTCDRARKCKRVPIIPCTDWVPMVRAGEVVQYINDWVAPLLPPMLLRIPGPHEQSFPLFGDVEHPGGFLATGAQLLQTS